MGGGAMIRLAGRQQRLSFPACADPKQLASHLGSWMSSMETHGESIDPELAFTMLMTIIPADLRKDILRREDLQRLALPDLIEFIKTQTTWIRNEALVQNLLNNADRHAPVTVITEDPQKAPTPPPPRPHLDVLKDTLPTLV